jgi:hypothetical protein
MPDEQGCKELKIFRDALKIAPEPVRDIIAGLDLRTQG